jgi:hypothetical protein
MQRSPLATAEKALEQRKGLAARSSARTREPLCRPERLF